MFLKYQSIGGKKFALHPAQVRATIGGVGLTIRVKKPFDEVYAEWEQARERGGEE
jgi:hypothetical protein